MTDLKGNNMELITKIEISSEELSLMCKKRIDGDADTMDNRDRLFDNLLEYGCTFCDKDDFRENLAGAIMLHISKEEFIELMSQYEKDYE